MFKKILAPVDGSVHAKNALKAAWQLSKELHGELLILHVSEITPFMVGFNDPTGIWISGYLNEINDKLKEMGDRILSESRDIVGDKNVKTVRESGSPHQVICEVAEREKCDLIVMGSRGLSDFQGFFLGSVSHRVLQKSHIPVLLVK